MRDEEDDASVGRLFFLFLVLLALFGVADVVFFFDHVCIIVILIYVVESE